MTDTNPKSYDLVDEFIAETCEIGDEFSLADYRQWLSENYPDEEEQAAVHLQTHRRSPKKRVFTTECLTHRVDPITRIKYEGVGMGPKAVYRVVETDRSVRPTALLKMHQREVVEMFARWENEARFRMDPLATRSKRARAAFAMAQAEIRQAVLTLHARLRFFDVEEGEDDEEAAA